MECEWDETLLAHAAALPAELLEVVRTGGDEQYLLTIARASLDRRYTDILLSSCEPIFAHCCAIWPEHGSPAAIVAGLGRVVPFAPYLIEHAELYLRSHQHIFGADTATDLDYLVGLYRLIVLDASSVRQYVKATQIQPLLEHNDRAIRYMAIRILQLYLSAADAAFEQMVERYTGKDAPSNPITGPWEDKEIDYRFFSLWEDNRTERMVRQLRESRDRRDCRTVVSGRRVLPGNAFQSSTALIGDVLLPRSSTASGQVSPRDTSVVVTKTIASNLRNIAEAFKSTGPILLTGNAGSGKTLLVRHVAARLDKLSTMITLHLNEQSDAKLLIGLYTSGTKRGSFVWRPGVLTTAVQEGRWIFIEDLDRAPNEIISTLLPLIEWRELVLPSRGQTLSAAKGFRIIATVRTTSYAGQLQSKPLANMVGRRHWRDVRVEMPALSELEEIATHLHPNLVAHLPQCVAVYERLLSLRKQSSLAGQSRTGILRPLSPRDLLKWCSRISEMLQDKQTFTSSDLDNVFLEAVDCFVGALPCCAARDSMTASIAEELQIDPRRRDHLLDDRDVKYEVDQKNLKIGHYALPRKQQSRKPLNRQVNFSTNAHTARMLERVAAAVVNKEPLLLVGETGVGKTTAVQHLADNLNKKLVPFNLSQQSESGDLLGGFKPVNARSLIVPMKDEFDELFSAGFSYTKNQQFLEMLNKQIAQSNWKAACKLWQQALKMVDQQRAASSRDGSASPARPGATKHKKRRIEQPRAIEFAKWEAFAHKVNELEHRLSAGGDAFAFDFVEGNIVKAVRNGDWVLLDEINLASSDTLEALADLLDNSPSLLLTEAGSIERIAAHPEFRIFAAMNPATDVGKKDLPAGIRSRFTELYVEGPDKDAKSLQSIVRTYLRNESTNDQKMPVDVTTLYQQIIRLSEENSLVDGAAQKPHFSLRTLTRALSYAKVITPLCSLRRALYEGFQMSFLTILDMESEKLVQPLLAQNLFGKNRDLKSELSRPLQKPKDKHEYVREGLQWVRKGEFALEEQPYYIKTPFIERNLNNLMRASSAKQSPVLIQGPTSSGKTSMIEYLAKRTGNKFVRINNHEHTDLQEYLGTYISGMDGRLQFQEGILVKALREGHWIVLDELNLAPTDVLEALNRLLDDNRELLIPETQEVVRPHENFMLFATQNPAGLYGGRKTLSRAFRNRFLELHFDDIPVDELQEILERRTQLPGSWCKRIVTVYRELSALRQENRVFEQKSFATLRDLFRWALREAETVQQLAENGFMLLAERVRKPEEREAVKATIERVMSERGPKVRIDEAKLYAEDASPVQRHRNNASTNTTVWTKAMRRLYVLVENAVANNEPVLLVGDTGCGKTTVCQMLAETSGKTLHIVNAHQNTETGDLIGSQRPVRNRAAIEAHLRDELMNHSMLQDNSGVTEQILDLSTNDLLNLYDRIWPGLDASKRSWPTFAIPHAKIQAARFRWKALFEWADGSLVHAMRLGHYFLLDEISLADDSVLERINSVLEPSRSILLAEKGSLDSFVEAVPGFQFLATMNPGGDYGKRELSPALRNRFTEIWVPNLSDSEDVLQIVSAKLDAEASQYAEATVAFAQWFNERYNTSATSAISIRDMLAWVDFVNSVEHMTPVDRVAHGAAMIYVDTLGANPAGLVSINVRQLDQERHACFDELGRLLCANARLICLNPVVVNVTNYSFNAGPFLAARRTALGVPTHAFTFDPPTTRVNTMRVLRALQLTKPILLEGNPGVGKTTLITAIATAVGVALTRINLSEQSDLMDLFGSDVPVDGAAGGEFAWHDASFLRAMKDGGWVLLDEMNLASQSVLEGLNACLDHRGEVFISELGLTFKRHPDFRLFAAQNPHHQGGGRKGLPASFVNRFTVVFADVFRHEDLLTICRRSFSQLPERDLEAAITFVDHLDDAVQRRQIGTLGSPWELNLRDTIRWLSLIASDEGLLRGGNAYHFLDLVFAQRFRTASDRAFVHDTFRSFVQDTPAASNLFYNVSPMSFQVGMALLPRNAVTAKSLTGFSFDVRDSLRTLESLMICVQCNWPVVLTGPSGAGKTNVIESLAKMVGRELATFSLNADIDAADLIGGFEQADSQRLQAGVFTKLRDYLNRLCVGSLAGTSSITTVKQCLDALDRDDNPPIDMVRSILTACDKFESLALLLELEATIQSQQTAEGVKFEWIDGILVNALQDGKWLVLDNANLCNPSVLDRLNSLLEPDGALIINEHTAEDGQPRSITPHPDFRIFLLADPRFGELSRAMRNRAVEIFMPAHANNVLSLNTAAICSESVIHRFRQAKLVSAGVKIESATKTELPRLLWEQLSLTDAPLQWRFNVQAAAGIIQDDSHDVFELPVGQAALLSQRTRDSRNVNEFYTRATEHVQAPADFANAQVSLVHPAHLGRYADSAVLSQPFHFLNNEPLFNSTLFTLQDARDIASIHDIGWDVTNMQSSLKALHSSTATSSKPTVLQRSMMSSKSRGKVINVAAGAHPFFGRIVKILSSCLPSSTSQIAPSAEARTGHEGGRSAVNLKALCRFWCLLWDFLNTTDIEPAMLQAYISCGRNLIVRSHQMRESRNSLRTDLLAAFDALGQPNKLTTGLEMTALWTHLKPMVPETFYQLQKSMAFQDVMDAFDASALHPSALLEKSAILRLQLLKAYRLIRTQGADSGDLIHVRFVDSLHLEPPLTELQKFQSLLRDSSSQVVESQAVRPFFERTFNMLCRRFVILHIDRRLMVDDVQMSKLEILAGRSSKDGFSWTLKEAQKNSDSNQLKIVSALVGAHDGLALSFEGCGGAQTIMKGLLSSREVPLKQLNLLKVELATLGHTIAATADSVCDDLIKALDKLLQELLQSILLALSSDGDDEAIREWASTAQIRISSKKEMECAGACKSADPPALTLSRSGVVQRLNRCIDYLATNIDSPYEGLLNASQAWMNFALACIELYVPDQVFDPVLGSVAEKQLFYEHQRDLHSKLTTLREFEGAFTGQKTNLRIRLLEQDIQELGNEPRAAAVARPLQSELPRLQNEFSILLRTISTLSEANDLAAFNDVTLWQNIRQIRERLCSSYRAYEDMTLPLIGFLDSLKVAHALAQQAEVLGQQSKTDELSPMSLVPLADARPIQWFSDLAFSERLNICAGWSVRIFCLSALAVRSSVKPVEQWTPLLRRTVDDAFESFYQQWKTELARGQKSFASKSNLYKYRGSLEDEDDTADDDYNELFPSYVQADPTALLPSASDSAHVQGLAASIATVHRTIFEPPLVQSNTLLNLLRESSEMMILQCNGNVSNEAAMPLMLLELSEHALKIQGSRDVKVYNIYSDANASQASKLLALVMLIQTRFLQISTAWPEHAVPAAVLLICSEITAMPHADPVAKFLIKVEKLHETVHQWQRVASQEYSASQLYQRITDLLVSWRQLELSTWSRMLDLETEKCERGALEWWFIAYENIIAIPVAMQDSEAGSRTHAVSLLATLDSFLLDTGLGQYKARLQLLGDFQAALRIRVEETPTLRVVRDALANLVAYFSHFEKPVAEALSNGRKALEKDVQSIIQLAAWKDRNIDELRQSAKASHRRLFKLVRKYRALLSHPVSSIIAAGVRDANDRQGPPMHKGRHLDEFNGTVVADAILINDSEDFVWGSRPTRFRNVASTLRIMQSKASRIGNTETATEEIVEFVDSLAKSMAILQKVAPAKQTEKNSEIIKHLKARKRRLLADTLKAIKGMGFKSNLSGHVLHRQASLHSVLATVPVLGSSKHYNQLSQAELHLHQILSIMPNVRNAARQHSEDLTSAEVARCVANIESILQVSIDCRVQLQAITSENAVLERCVSQFRCICDGDMHLSGTPPPTTAKELLPLLGPVLGATSHIVCAQAALCKADYSKLEEELQGWSNKFANHNGRSQRVGIFPHGLQSGQDATNLSSLVTDLERLRTTLKAGIETHPELRPVLSNCLHWTVFEQPNHVANDAVNGCDQMLLADWTKELLDVADNILIVFQELEVSLAQISTSTEGSSWLIRHHQNLLLTTNALRCRSISTAIAALLNSIQNIDRPESNLPTLTHISRTLVPMIQAYASIHDWLIVSLIQQQGAIAMMAYELAKTFVHLSKEGFCQQSENLAGKENGAEAEAGTGLGDGRAEGAEDISKDIKDDEDLTDLAQESAAKGDKEGEIEDEKDAVDMADQEMEGELDDSAQDSGDEGETESRDAEQGAEIDEEAGSVDDLGPSTVDEKMWNDDGNDDSKAKDTENADGGLNEDDVAATEDAKDRKQKEKQDLEADEGVEDAADESEAVTQDNLDKTDPHLEEHDNLDLPEDIDMDAPRPEKHDDSDLASLAPSEAGGDAGAEDIDQTVSETANSEAQLHGEDDHEDQGSETAMDAAGEVDDDVIDQRDGEDGLLQQQSNERVGTGDDVVQDTAQGTGLDNALNRAQEQVPLGSTEQADNPDARPSYSKAQDGTSGGHGTHERDAEADFGPDSSAKEQSLPYKQLGDMLESWYKQQRQIHDAKEQPDDDNRRSSDDVEMADAEFEHLPNSEAAADAQALGAATEEQSKAIDDSKALDVNENVTSESVPHRMFEDEAQVVEDDIHMENAAELDTNDRFQADDRSKAFVGQVGEDMDEIDIEEEAEAPDKSEDEIEDVDDQLTRTHLARNETGNALTEDEARRLWNEHETSTRSLALVLTEHLRLILHPTQATKMRGDFRTGKRLNIKRIIPYIASGYKRDKIWMRRSVPSKRTYQVMLAIDDSKSMAESESKELAFETLALIARSLAMLEVGELCVVAFGEEVKLAHDFSTPFTSEAGAQVFRHMSFAQTRTNVRRLISETSELFRNARLRAAGSASELWQLQLIVSDGMCEKHAVIRQLVRQAHEERIMLVFIIVDTGATPHKAGSAPADLRPQSIMDMSTAAFVDDVETGESELRMGKYLDTFPFKYYLVVRDVVELPGVLAGALRQWFAEVMDTGAY